jgi:hypothetical protein
MWSSLRYFFRAAIQASGSAVCEAGFDQPSDHFVMSLSFMRGARINANTLKDLSLSLDHGVMVSTG